MTQHRTRPGRLRTVIALCCAVLLSALLSSCGLGTAGGFTRSGVLSGDLAGIESLEGAELSVGSKNFSEQLFLGKVAVILLKSAGAEVADLTNIPGSSSSREALLQGEVQMVWEYTGTAWIAYLGNDDAIPDEQEQWQAVADADAKNGLTWLEPAPMNNTYGFAVPRKKAEQLGISSLSDVKDLPVDQQTFCVESEFKNRNDGFDPMLKAYDVPALPRANVKTFDTGAIYAATSQGECTFGEVFTTDGRIKALDLVVMEDDRNFFPKYNVAAVFNTETLDEYPQLAELFGIVSSRLTDEVLLEQNAKIDVDGDDPAQVAWDWLVAEGFVAPQ